MTIVNTIKRWYFNAGKKIEKWLDDRVWNERLAVALKGVEKPELPYLEAVLKNQIDHFRRIYDYGGTTSSSYTTRAARLKSDNGMFKLAVAVARELYRLTALVGVQPMQGPVSLAYTMRYTLKEDNSSSPKASESAKAIRLEVRKDAVEAGSRRLQAMWSMEAAQDLATQHGLDLEEEFTAVMADQIAHEVFTEVLADLAALAKRGGNVNAMPWSPVDINDENMQMLSVTLNSMANDIARKTRRGCGNFVVTTPIGVALLQSSAKSVFAPAPKGERGSSALMLVGTLNGTMKVYSSMCLLEDMFIVGYKGGSGEVDAGYIYCPYVPVMPSGVVIDPNTFQPVQTMMTRYGKFVFHAGDTAMASSEDYFSVLKFLQSELPPASEVDQPEVVV